MAARPAPFQIGDFARADFRTSAEADAANGRLQKDLGLSFRYQPARLAVGRSLALAEPPATPADMLGKPIRGDTLFGQDEADLATWAGLLVERHRLVSATRKELQDLVAGHWARGIEMLTLDLDACGGDATGLFASLLPPSANRSA